MTSENTFALLIGVSHYPQWQGAGLRGAVNDARAWRSLCLETLGVPPENVRLLCSPMEGLAAGEEAATEAQLRAGVAWLGDQMAAATAAGAAPSGLIVFCGHGAALPDAGEGPLGIGVGLCAADLRRTEAGEVAGVFPVEALQATLAERCRAGGQDPDLSWPRDVTVVLDCCYSAVTGLTLAEPLPSSPRPDRSQNLCRYLLACDPWSVSYELQSLGRWHGAFSYTLLTLLEQWTTRAEGGAAWFDVSAQTLIQRSAAMLEQLGLQQQPTLAGAPRVGMVPFLRPGLTVGPNLCAPFPNRRRPKAQIDAGTTGYRLFQVSVSANSQTYVVAYVVVAGDDGDYHYQSFHQKFHWSTEAWYPLAVQNLPVQNLQTSSVQVKINVLAWDKSWLLLQGDLKTIGLQTTTPKVLSGFGPFQSTQSVSASDVSGTLMLSPQSDQVQFQLPAGIQLGFSEQAGCAQLTRISYACGQTGSIRFFGGMGSSSTEAVFTGQATGGDSDIWVGDLSLQPMDDRVLPEPTFSGTTGSLLNGQQVKYAAAWVDNTGAEGCFSLSRDWTSIPPGATTATLTILVSPPHWARSLRLYRRSGFQAPNPGQTAWVVDWPVTSQTTRLTITDNFPTQSS